MKKILSLIMLVCIIISAAGLIGVFSAESNVVFSEEFDETVLSVWTTKQGNLTVEDDAIVFESTASPGRFCYGGTDIRFEKNSRYRVSYTSKISQDIFYYMGIELYNAGSWQLTRNGSFVQTLYDNTYRPGSRNYDSEGNVTLDWSDVSYEFSVYNLKDVNGNTVEYIDVPKDKLFFVAGNGNTLSVKNLKIEKIGTTADTYYKSVYYYDFSSQGKWTVTNGTASVEGGALTVKHNSTAYLKINLPGITFNKNSKYRVSYRTKVENISYFLIYNFSTNTVQHASGGTYSKELYDHSMSEGGRGTARYYVNCVQTTDWYDVSYEVSFYDIKGSGGTSQASVPLNYMQFQINSSGDFSIDYIKIEEITENVGFSYDETMGKVSLDGVEFGNGDRVTAANGTISVSANDGYYFKELVVTDKSGNKQTYLTGGSFVFDADTTISVVFEKDSAKISKSSSEAYNSKNGVLVFAGINTAGKTVSEYGIDLKNDKDSFRLKADGTAGLSAANEFGIRAFGSWFIPGNYQVKAYAMIDGDEVTDDWTTVTITEEE